MSYGNKAIYPGELRTVVKLGIEGPKGEKEEPGEL
jgi:hypothetical protein